MIVRLWFQFHFLCDDDFTVVAAAAAAAAAVVTAVFVVIDVAPNVAAPFILVASADNTL